MDASRRVMEHLLRDGHRVATTARKPEQLADLAERYKDQLWTAALDVTDGNAMRSTVDRAFAELGRIDVVFSNAGYGQTGAAEEIADAEIDRLLDTNLRGPIRLARAVLPHLRAHGGSAVATTPRPSPTSERLPTPSSPAQRGLLLSGSFWEQTPMRRSTAP